MNKYHKIIIGIFVIAGLYYLYISDLSQGVKIALLVGVAVLYLIRYVEKRFQLIENAININVLTDGGKALIPLSYKIRILIYIRGEEIIKLCFPDLNNDDQVWNFVNNIYRNPDYALNGEESLLHKGLQFVIYYDGLSGMYQIWSDNKKTFLDVLEIRECILGRYSPKLFEEYPRNKIGNYLCIRPDYIGFEGILPDGSIMEEDIISRIPYSEIVLFLKQIYIKLGRGSAMYGINKFPQPLQDYFDKYEVKYEIHGYEDYGCGGGFNNKLIESKWLKENNVEICEQKMRKHIFTTPYYSIEMNIDFFN